ncbi:hypothetical protein Q4561_13870 [Alteromonas sp. 1_MG-2023]|uniref:hypothetical protein n=1 Tax=Alteromonas sp. 1_MG-2023 TaxID=3062669 RepID=UPI0026E1263D|nr:hypothetical protein [Alteromonas sp. 1_MG-2023]MDO6568155.1 hypothetical protein [Alteromonas sp. 1_MG-2023]
MEVYRKVKQTKFVKDGLRGLLTVHDHGGIAVSADHKTIFNGLNYEEVDSYLYISKPSTKDKTLIMDRLFS